MNKEEDGVEMHGILIILVCGALCGASAIFLFSSVGHGEAQYVGLSDGICVFDGSMDNYQHVQMSDIQDCMADRELQGLSNNESAPRCHYDSRAKATICLKD